MPRLFGRIERQAAKVMPDGAFATDEAADLASRRGFDAATMQCLMDRFEEVYRRHSRIAVDLAAPLLAGLNPEQIRTLDRNFRAECSCRNSPAWRRCSAPDRAERWPGVTAECVKETCCFAAIRLKV